MVAGAVVSWWLPAAWLDWQPGLAFTEPWRWWSAAFVHWSEHHLLANLAGAALVGALGVVPRLHWHAAAAWALAWPLVHLPLLLQPGLAHYGGLSGVMHAGVTAASVGLCRDRRTRFVGVSLLIGTTVKVLTETPWGAPLRQTEGWDIAIAPLAHATGAVAGALLSWALPHLLPRQSAQ
jgi:rhomboid family GlyGly-CTERM serine protease